LVYILNADFFSHEELYIWILLMLQSSNKIEAAIKNQLCKLTPIGLGEEVVELMAAESH
jgi:hypothetical protein